MKRFIAVILLVLVVATVDAQPKRRGGVKRKYRKVEQTGQNLPQVFFRGIVRDAEKQPIAGARLEIEGLKRSVHSNENGEFALSGLPTGKLRITISCLGYRTKKIDYVLQPGFNDHYIALDIDRIHPEPVYVTAQDREQQISDIPASATAVTGWFAEKLNVTDFGELAGFLPGLWFQDAGAGNSGFSIGGSGAGAGFPAVSPSVALLIDGVPVLQPGGYSARFFDMNRVEILQGPQNVLFGRDASGGAVHLITKKPEKDFGGYLSATGGDFGKREVHGALNIPVIEEMLFLRTAGVYQKQDGYIENTAGGTLNGDNRVGGRFSVRFLPAFDHKADLALSYQKDDSPGIGFMNRWNPNEAGETGLWSYRTSHGAESISESGKELMDASLTYRLFRNEHNYWTSVSAYRLDRTRFGGDGDGTALPALRISEEGRGRLFFQEVRYNFSRRSRTNGSFGVSYRNGKRNNQQNLWSNDQHLFFLLSHPGSFIMPDDSRYPAHPQPLNTAPMSGLSFSGDHQEAFSGEWKSTSYQGFIQLTHQLTRRFFFNGGVRAVYDRLKYIHEVAFSGGEESTLGAFSGTAPNLLFRPAGSRSIHQNSLFFTGEAGIIFRWNEDFRLFVKASRGRKPHELQFSWDGQPNDPGPEKINNLEAGWKLVVADRIYWDVTGFYQQHAGVRTVQWTAAAGSGLLDGNGKATAYGVNAGLRAALLKGLNLFGHYAWLQSAFDSTGVDGSPYIFAGNRFALAPEHSLSAGFRGEINIFPSVKIFTTPWYAWKSHFWFSSANIPGLDQPAFTSGMLNVTAGMELADPSIVFTIFGSNLLEERVIASAGHQGGLFGLPTFVPGPPRMVGAKLTWRFLSGVPKRGKPGKYRAF